MCDGFSVAGICSRFSTLAGDAWNVCVRIWPSRHHRQPPLSLHLFNWYQTAAGPPHTAPLFSPSCRRTAAVQQGRSDITASSQPIISFVYFKQHLTAWPEEDMLVLLEVAMSHLEWWKETFWSLRRTKERQQVFASQWREKSPDCRCREHVCTQIPDIWSKCISDWPPCSQKAKMNSVHCTFSMSRCCFFTTGWAQCLPLSLRGRIFVTNVLVSWNPVPNILVSGRWTRC